jgi:hypothetical protein
MQQMQAHMQTMHALMERALIADSQPERNRLMQEHMQSMREGMAMMQRMPMPDGAMGQRMGMMQDMMGQMMRHMMQDHAGSDEGSPGATPQAPPLGQPQSSAPAAENHEQHH